MASTIALGSANAGLLGLVDPLVQQCQPAPGQPVDVEIAAAVLLHRSVLDPHCGQSLGVRPFVAFNHGLTGYARPGRVRELTMTVLPDDFVAGLEGVVAFTTEIAEPDKDGGSPRYRGVDIEDLVVHRVTFGDVWALLVDGRFGDGLVLLGFEPFPLPIHTGDVRVDVQAGLAMLAPIWGYQPLLDIDDETARGQLARASVMALSYVAQSARGPGRTAVPQRVIDECATVTERFMTRWHGEPDPRYVEAIDAYWVSAAEHG